MRELSASDLTVEEIKLELIGESKDEDVKFLGQDRALKALDFGLAIKDFRYNIFVVGHEGMNKRDVVLSILKSRAKELNKPDDVIYVFNFKNPDMPRVLYLPAGKGRIFKKYMNDFVVSLKSDLPKKFESKEYEVAKRKLIEEFQRKRSRIFAEFEEEVSKYNFAIRTLENGVIELFAVSPSTKAPFTEEEYRALSDEDKEKIQTTGEMLNEKMNEALRQIREEEKNLREKAILLDKEFAASFVDNILKQVRDEFYDRDDVLLYLDEIRSDLLDRVQELRASVEQNANMPFLMRPSEPSFDKYLVNLFVDNSETEGAPVVYLSNSSYGNLFGKIEYKFVYGAAVTDFTQIKSGAINKANHGFLILDAQDLLKNIFSYDALKRALKEGKVRIEDPWEPYRVVSSGALKPEAIDLDLKVILIGSSFLYEILSQYDDEFRELFNVKVDFDDVLNSNLGLDKYVSLIKNISRNDSLLPLSESGINYIIKESARIAGQKNKFSLRSSMIRNLLTEANYFAIKSGSSEITGSHVRDAIKNKVFRNGRIEERIQEAILEDTIIVRTSGEMIGQVNGLAIMSLGGHLFGKPARITAQVYAGKRGVLNIEREVKMSGQIHDKAVFILSGYLGYLFGQKRPLSFSASITFEQLYSGIEGDSATCAEFYALISALSNIPLKQNVAITGSMDQWGEVQPIGGVNEKIEGFFDLCKARDVNDAMVIIPERNVNNLILRDEVIEAVKEGKFKIFAISRVEEGLKILTGLDVDSKDDNGNFIKNSVYYFVEKRLEEFAKVGIEEDKKKNS
ncbi:lon-related putative ATP-dependent protease [Thermodesulfobium acidiphilum]|uniref:endopeptidase La n=1 Tax=Thermodesulfobium acidiphilum TaxID=1794699 RepID=A0A2R4VY43_THEAF|nr:ATP-binding protein [Thermodesulfobium acidiphilum]AWB09461.1 lon-related putative ATP-dependent protease [Thermodesulfobium acidiphilum]